MSIFSHNVYENVRTRTIVLYDGRILLHPPRGGGPAWALPGGGLEPGESLAECGAREVLEEIGVQVQVGRIVFLVEWVVPTYTSALEPGDGHGFGTETLCRRSSGRLRARGRCPRPTRSRRSKVPDRVLEACL